MPDFYITPFSVKCCISCGERRPGCHSTCERYIKDKAEMKKKADKYKKDRLNDSIVGEIQFRNRGKHQ